MCFMLLLHFFITGDEEVGIQMTRGGENHRLLLNPVFEISL